jgi:hypothetical protein
MTFQGQVVDIKQFILISPRLRQRRNVAGLIRSRVRYLYAAKVKEEYESLVLCRFYALLCQDPMTALT